MIVLLVTLHHMQGFLNTQASNISKWTSLNSAFVEGTGIETSLVKVPSLDAAVPPRDLQLENRPLNKNSSSEAHRAGPFDSKIHQVSLSMQIHWLFIHIQLSVKR